MQDNEQLQSVVYFLSDHLCSAIDIGEEMFNLRYASQEMTSTLTTEDILDRLDEFHQFLDEIRTQEYMFLSKINQVRHWCIHLRHLDLEFRPVIDLFNAATKSVADIEAVLGMNEQSIFDGEHTHQHLIDSRQLLTEPKQAGKGHPKRISVDENFLLGGTAPLVELLEACNGFLDSLDIRFDVVEEVDEATEGTQVSHIADKDEILQVEAKSGT